MFNGLKYTRCIIPILLFLLPGIISCQKIDDVEISEDGLYHDQPANEGERNALEKARLVAEVEWTPLNPVPSCYGTPYPAGVTRYGLPYSLAQKVNGYVGLDVSFYTFLTAINNPRSVMYTENLRHAPYNGFDCAPYYGSVCATSVWYVLGIKAPYYTYSIGHIKALSKRVDLPPDSIRLCDVLWKTGHVAMVYDICRDSNDIIRKVVVFETTTRSRIDSKLVEYSYDAFVEKWNNSGWIIYRPKDLSSNPAANEPFAWRTGHLVPLFSYNNDLCTTRGDRVSYSHGDSVVLNVFNRSYPVLELLKDGELYQSVSNERDEFVFRNLPYGSYQARLTNGVQTSDPVFFEIIDINVSFTIGDKLIVYFSSANAVPEFMSLGDERECPYYCTIFTPEQVAQGSAAVKLNGEYLKVHFRGQYGRVSNKLIKVK